MDDDSDDGTLPGQSYFRNNNYEEEQINEICENGGNENYDENYENQYSQYNGNYYYENDNYNDDDNYQENLDNENYIDNENSNYSNSFKYENADRYYKKYNYSNKNKNKNYKYNYYNHHYKKYSLTKTKESYLTTFSTNFKLWLMLVIKLNKEQGKIIKISENKSINNEIIESFLKNYEIELNNKKGKENDKKNNLYISIKNVDLKHTVDKIYIVEFSIIIEDKIELFFVNKYIEIFVKGEIYFEKYPKFSFQVKEYKLTLDLEKDKNNNDNIIEIPNIEKEFDKCEIGMCPTYCINENKEFKKIYIDINGEDNIKDPQREIRDCLDNLMF